MHFGQYAVIFIFKWKLKLMVFYGFIAARALLHSFFDRLTVVSAGKEKRVVSNDFCSLIKRNTLYNLLLSSN